MSVAWLGRSKVRPGRVRLREDKFVGSFEKAVPVIFRHVTRGGRCSPGYQPASTRFAALPNEPTVEVKQDKCQSRCRPRARIGDI